jgi:hypothetical protein
VFVAIGSVAVGPLRSLTDVDGGVDRGAVGVGADEAVAQHDGDAGAPPAGHDDGDHERQACEDLETYAPDMIR